MSHRAVNRNRDDHLFESGPKRILSLDGGGVLGLVEIAFLEQIEMQLCQLKKNPNLVLADYFDLIGGTSTGAIIATALSLEMTAQQVKELYFQLAPRIFQNHYFPFGSSPLSLINEHFTINSTEYWANASFKHRI